MHNSNIRKFLYVAMPVILIGLVGSLATKKGDFVIYLNQHHYSLLDIFFKYYTHLGSGFILLALGVFFLRRSYRMAIIVVLVSICQGATVAIFKLLFFPNLPRPPAYLADQYQLNYVSGVDILYSRSFPSGHTLTAFGVAALLAFGVKSIWIQILLLLYAVLVAISRMYLSHHFLIDTATGAFLGVILTLTVCAMAHNSKLLGKDSLKRGLLGE